MERLPDLVQLGQNLAPGTLGAPTDRRGEAADQGQRVSDRERAPGPVRGCLQEARQRLREVLEGWRARRALGDRRLGKGFRRRVMAGVPPA